MHTMRDETEFSPTKIDIHTTMNTKRMLKFGRYDLTINKVFYRNMALMSAGIGVGISLLGFFGRWLVYKSAGGSGDYMQSIYMNTFASPTLTPLTSLMLTAAFGLLLCIFAGCTFHTLRKKQGRINELTLPATNAEKYCWHVLLSLGGGLLLAVGMLLSADVINLLLTLLVYGSDATLSLTLRVFENLTLSGANDSAFTGPAGDSSILTAFRVCTILASLSQICIYIYGNSVKYRFNILITYGVMMAISTVLYILGIVLVICFSDSLANMTAGQIYNGVTGLLYAVAAIATIAGGLGIWRSYKRYCKAQISARFNR